MRISHFARLSSAKSEIRVSLVNNDAVWLIRHVATTDNFNKTMKQRKNVAYLVTCSDLFFASTVAFPTEQESANSIGTLSGDMTATPTTPPTTATPLVLCLG